MFEVKKEFIYNSSRLEGLPFSRNCIEEVMEYGSLYSGHNPVDVKILQNHIKLYSEVLCKNLEENVTVEGCEGWIRDLCTIEEDTERDKLYRREGCREYLADLLEEYKSRRDSSQITLEYICEVHLRYMHLEPFVRYGGILGRLLLLRHMLECRVGLGIVSANEGKLYRRMYTTYKEGRGRLLKDILIRV